MCVCACFWWGGFCCGFAACCDVFFVLGVKVFFVVVMRFLSRTCECLFLMVFVFFVCCFVVFVGCCSFVVVLLFAVMCLCVVILCLFCFLCPVNVLFCRILL